MALGDEIVSRIIGYDLLPGNFLLVSPNLPVMIGIYAEANEANQATLNTQPQQITNVAQAAAIGGWGSPIYQISKILFPRSGGNLGGIPVVVYPQAKAGGAAAKVMTITATGNATGTGTHYVRVAGRKSVEGTSYAVNIANGDTPTIIHNKIQDAINNVLGSPMTGVGAVGQCTCTAKWKGLSSDAITLVMDTNGNSLGVTYATATTTPGSGVPSVDASLAMIGNQWLTHIISGYGLEDTTMASFEAFNGRPVIGANPSSGRYVGTTFKPLFTFCGTTAADPSAITDAHLNDCTVVPAVAPNSPNLPMEVAASWAYLAAICHQQAPHLDITGQSLPLIDGPINGDIGVMATFSERDRIVKKGCCTVSYIGGQYVIEDPVTTYHPAGETVPQFRYMRTLVIDWNVRFGYLLREQRVVKDHAIAKDDQKVIATKVVKPKMWKAEMADYADELVLRALSADKQFMIDNTTVALSATVPDRFKTAFQYKRTPYVRQSDTAATAGFYFGSLTAN